ncbi:hypothetical protein HRI_001988400 [Hibiscus trionum]|uniref:POX domain-containing protein n=1 Tax=Hibiscus trionum TaxID=183268 RepID=A0A9W7HTM8_HIBTR|nr:hypothetical protein HRI_001988400 [Hibiscus trionum]
MDREICDDKSRNNIVSSAGFCYSDVSSGNSTHLVNQIQGFASNPEIFNLTTGIEMVGFFNKNGSNSTACPSSKAVNESTTEFYQHGEFHKPEFTTGLSQTSTENLIVGTESGAWQENKLLVDDSSLRCVFPGEGNERPSQGLSLSLSSSNPAGIGLQSFNQHDDISFIGSSSSRDGFFVKPANLHHQGQFQLRNSNYLGPAQELLNEFCSLGTKQIDASKQKMSTQNNNKQWDGENGASSSIKHSLDFMELQKRKIKLLSVLENGAKL